MIAQSGFFQKLAQRYTMLKLAFMVPDYFLHFRDKHPLRV